MASPSRKGFEQGITIFPNAAPIAFRNGADNSHKNFYLNNDDEFIFESHISASTDNLYDLGQSSIQWRNLYLAGDILLGSELRLERGTAAAPTICFDDDRDGSGTGIYSSAANNIDLVTNGNVVSNVDVNGSWTFGVAGVTTATHTFRGCTTLTETNAYSGGDLLLQVSNTSNTASSRALVRALVAGTSASDPALQLQITSGTSWYVGVDNSADDVLSIGKGSTVGTDEYLRITTSGAVYGALAHNGLVVNGKIVISGGDVLLKTLAGGDPSATDPVSIICHDNTASPTPTIFRITSTTGMFFDASNITGNFGTDNTEAWSSDMPLYIYLITDGTTPRLVLSRLPHLKEVGAAARLAKEGAAGGTDDFQTVFVSALNAVDVSGYANQPVWRIGGVRGTKDGSNVWSFSSLNIDSGDGLRFDPFNGVSFVFPDGQNGKTASSPFAGTTPPTWVTVVSAYTVGLDGYVDYHVITEGNCTAGTGANALQIPLPLGYVTPAAIYGSGVTTQGEVIGTYTATTAATATGILVAKMDAGSTIKAYQSTLVALDSEDFSAAGDDVCWHIRYKAGTHNI